MLKSLKRPLPPDPEIPHSKSSSCVCAKSLQLCLTLCDPTDCSMPGLMVQNLPANAGDRRDVGLTPRRGRYPGEGNGSRLQYSYLDNPMEKKVHIKDITRNIQECFPGGPVVKNSPANARDMGSIPGLGRFHMPNSN